MEKLNPLVDFAFKKLFGVDENKDILIDLINAVVSEEDQIIDLEIKNPYNEKAFKHDKLSILDIKARGANKRWYVIEMQVLDQQYFDARTLYYWSRVYHSQLANGINYDCLEKTISINFLNFDCLDEDRYHNVYRLKNIDSGNEYPNEHIEIHFIELKKYHESFSSMLDRWANFLLKAYEYDSKHLPKELQIPTIEKAVEALEQMYLTADERESYEARLKWLRDEEMALKKAKEDGKVEGIEIGKVKGIEIGTVKGIEIGTVKGIEIGTVKGIEIGEQRNTVALAKGFIKQGIDLEIISKVTGLSKEELIKLSSETTDS
jgi:predicted transposase/invertase (TIGR01784 family)